jgi:hypothetical protein
MAKPVKRAKSGAERSREYRERKRDEMNRLREQAASRRGNRVVHVAAPAGAPPQPQLLLNNEPRPVPAGLPAPRETRPLPAGGDPARFSGSLPLEPEPVEGAEPVKGATVLDAPAPEPEPDPGNQLMVAGAATMLVRYATKLAIARGVGDAAAAPLPPELVAAAREMGLDLADGQALADAGAGLVGGLYFEHCVRLLQKRGIAARPLPYQDEAVTIGGLVGSVLIVAADLKARIKAQREGRAPAPAPRRQLAEQQPAPPPAARRDPEPERKPPVRRSTWADLTGDTAYTGTGGGDWSSMAGEGALDG